MISKRLLLASKYTKGFNCLADCGTDHAYFPITCVLEGYVNKAYASDNKQKPLENAMKNIEKADLKGKVIPILAEGLGYISEEVDVASVMGMGGRMIVSILEVADLKNLKRLILIANSENFYLRDYLANNNWRIISEEFIKEKQKFYQLIIVEKGKMEISDLEKEFGPLIMKDKSPEFTEMIKKNIKKLITALNKTKLSSEKEKIAQRIKLLAEVIR